MKKTPFSVRLELSELSTNELTAVAMKPTVTLDDAIYGGLAHDTLAVRNYRSASDPVTYASFRDWFDDRAPFADFSFDWIDSRRDYVFTAAGVRALAARYLLKREPIQYAMLRIATIFVNRRRRDAEELKLFYDMLSTGMLHVSSILADAHNADAATIVPGEACRLMVCRPDYDAALIRQLERVCSTVSMGVGVGLGASTVPLYGRAEKGRIRSGFASFVKRLDSCSLMSLHERKPKTAVYVHVHNDTVFEALEVKKPNSGRRCENVFVGLLVSDYFMRCVYKNLVWYLFPADLRVDDVSLHDVRPDEYEAVYKAWVNAKLYTTTVDARVLMKRIVESLCTSGSPYVVWVDAVNRYNNQQHLGVVKTLNLCAEITNYADCDNSSSCTLMSANVALYNEHSTVQRSVRDYMTRRYGVRFEDFGSGDGGDDDDDNDRLARYSYTLGYMATVALNNLMDDRKRREIGVNPLGVYDAAVIADAAENPVSVCATVAEAMYKGAVQASCDYSRVHGIVCDNYVGSPFQFGAPQWKLRRIDERKLRFDWTELVSSMRAGMANSMLTSQAPTATTASLIGVTESVTVPVDLVVTRESENGRNQSVTYGLMCRKLRDPAYRLRLPTSVDTQVNMYAASAPFVDHSQSTVFAVNLSCQNVFDLIKRTHKSGLKTGIYYVVPRRLQPSLNIIRTRNNVSSAVKKEEEEEVEDGGRSDTCDSCAL